MSIENDFPSIKTNTIELETWLYPNWKVEDFCKIRIPWEEFDEDKDFFSEENKKKVFWDNYKSENIIETNIDWKNNKVKIPSIIIWWMWTNVSSASLIEGMNKLWFAWHLSSIWIWFYYFYEKYRELFSDKFTWSNDLNNIINNEFDSIFKDELWLSEKFIKKHFFECEELWFEINEDWKKLKNIGFNWELWKEKIMRMMDLIAIYKNIKNLKNAWNTVGINCMYKTSSYIAALKISIISWIDYITTAAWNPEINPKEFLKDFFKDFTNLWKDFDLPAFWLLVSSWNKRIFKDLDYDYYIFEEWEKAWWHIIRLGNKYDELEKIKLLFEKSWKKMPPVYAAWWVSTNKEIKEAFDAWFSWVQIWTLWAVSSEACDFNWKEFKESLIWWNHLWENREIDEKFFEEVKKVKNAFEKIVLDFNTQILHILELNKESPEIKKLKDYLFKIIYNDFFDEEIQNFEELPEMEKDYYNKIKEFFYTKYDWNIQEITKMFRNLWNSKKFLKEFDKFVEENGKLPTHLVFDSSVWFPWRTKIVHKLYEVIAWKIKSNWCVNCLTDCILAWRWNIRESRWSTFCISDRLNYLNKEKHLSFSWKSTVPYNEIRPIKDIMAYLMWTYIER